MLLGVSAYIKHLQVDIENQPHIFETVERKVFRLVVFEN